jgi:putative ABC transport system permease protein
VIVSQSLARKHWGNESPLGDRLLFHYDDQPGMVDGVAPWFTVVGIVDDIRFEALAQDTTPMIYTPIEQFWMAETLRVAVLADRDATALPALLRSSVASADPRTPVTEIRTFETKIGETIDRPRFATYALSVFSLIALLLASIGVYGVLSYAVSSRIREIGVRMALGANDTTVFRLLFGQGLRLTVVGLVLGVPLALGSTRLLSGMLFGVEPTSFGLVASVTAFLLVIGIAASYFPARRAMRIDAMQALRSP